MSSVSSSPISFHFSLEMVMIFFVRVLSHRVQQVAKLLLVAPLSPVMGSAHVSSTPPLQAAIAIKNWCASYCYDFNFFRQTFFPGLF
jgi:hypothetical protein